MNNPELAPTVSVIIPVYNEQEHIGNVLDEVLRQDYPSDRLEVVVVDGNSSDRTMEIVREKEAQDSRIRLLINHKSHVPISLNMGVQTAKGDHIIRLDAHASYPRNYISTLVDWQRRLGVENVGCVLETRVKADGLVGRAIELAMSMPAGVGNSRFRTGVDEAREVDTVPFGCYRRGVFAWIGWFDERLHRNQDIEFNKRLKSAGGRVLLIPRLRCIYYAPKTLWRLGRKSYDNGLWNILTVRYTGGFGSLSLRHYVPGVFILSLLIPLVVSTVWWPAGLLGLFSALLYLTKLAAVALPLVRRQPRLAALLPPTLAIMHICYGVGTVIGGLQLPFLRETASKGGGGMPVIALETQMATNDEAGEQRS